MNIQELILCCNTNSFEWAAKNEWEMGDITIKLMDSTAIAVCIEYPEKRYVVVPLEILERETLEEQILENVDFLANAGVTYTIHYRHREHKNELVDSGVRYLPLWFDNFSDDYEIMYIEEVTGK